MTRDFGRHLFGAAAIAFGIATLRWHAMGVWTQLPGLTNGPLREFLIYFSAAAALLGGAMLQWRRTAQLGAAVIAALYLIFALFWIPRIVESPLTYDCWGNFFEPLSIFAGALLMTRATNVGRVLFGICVISFALEQAFYLHATAELVPAWMPFGQTFWALATTAAFALAAAAILSDRRALLAARLLTIMLLLFGLLIWIPTIFAHVGNSFDWFETIETFAIAGSAWMLSAVCRPRE